MEAGTEPGGVKKTGITAVTLTLISTVTVTSKPLVMALESTLPLHHSLFSYFKWVEQDHNIPQASIEHLQFLFFTDL